MRYTVHSKVWGKIAQLGQRLIDGVAKSLAEDFFKRFDEALQAKFPAVESAADEGGQGETPVVAVPSASKVQRLLWPALVVVSVALLTWYFKR